jgi:hypothetical protein
MVRNGPIVSPFIFAASFCRAFWLRAACGPADLLSINYDVLPNIYAPKNRPRREVVGGFAFVAFS